MCSVQVILLPVLLGVGPEVVSPAGGAPDIAAVCCLLFLLISSLLLLQLPERVLVIVGGVVDTADRVEVVPGSVASHPIATYVD